MAHNPTLIKAGIRDICIDSKGSHLASVGEDKRIAFWEIKSATTTKIIEGAHSGVIFQVEFSDDDEILITCSEDGRVLFWNWRSGIQD